MKPLNLMGKTVGKLKVLHRVENRYAKSAWLCLCECGRTKSIIGSSLVRQDGTRSCGCVQQKTAQAVRRKRPFEYAYNTLVSGSWGRTTVDLTYEEFLIFTRTDVCHYCYAPIDWRAHGVGRYNLDRKDNNSGYSFQNCVVCCTRCNRGKFNCFTYEEWWAMTECFRRGAK